MSNFLIMPKNLPEHYFYKPYEGICVRKRTDTGVWQEHSSVFQDGKDGFGIYCSKDKSVHLICTDYSDNLIYAQSDGSEWKKYIISKLSSNIFISDMRLFSVRGRLNFIYSALYNGENLLIHCILGDHAKPSTIDVCEASHFMIKGTRVYYTNSKGILGFTDISDEKPSGFNPMYENAHFGTVYDINGTEKALFVRDGGIFLDGKEIIRDTHLEMPILEKIRNKFYIMWKNGSFIRYVTSDDGLNFSEPMRFMSTGKAMSLYTVQKGEAFLNYYGYHTAHELALLGNPEIFERSAEYVAKKEAELERVKNLLNQTQQDVVAAKKEIARLGRVIGTLTGKQSKTEQ